MSRIERCGWQDCGRLASHGLGWCWPTDQVRWYCGGHFQAALGRLGELLGSLGRGRQ